MSLVEHCEPLFQYVCRLNRSARKGGHFELGQVRSEVKALLADLRTQAAATPGLLESYEKTEIVLIFFVDFMVKESTLPFARDWQELAFERKEQNGDERFFDLLEETLKDRTPAAPERLAVFYTCMGLGFTGFYTGQPEYLRRKMKELGVRMQSAAAATAPGMTGGDAARICPDAYEHVDSRDLVEPPATKLLGIGIALLGLVIVLFFANAYLYHDRSKTLKSSLASITDNPPPTPPVPMPATAPAKENP